MGIGNPGIKVELSKMGEAPSRSTPLLDLAALSSKSKIDSFVMPDIQTMVAKFQSLLGAAAEGQKLLALYDFNSTAIEGRAIVIPSKDKSHSLYLVADQKVAEVCRSTTAVGCAGPEEVWQDGKGSRIVIPIFGSDFQLREFSTKYLAQAHLLSNSNSLSELAAALSGKSIGAASPEATAVKEKSDVSATYVSSLLAHERDHLVRHHRGEFGFEHLAKEAEFEQLERCGYTRRINKISFCISASIPRGPVEFANAIRWAMKTDPDFDLSSYMPDKSEFVRIAALTGTKCDAAYKEQFFTTLKELLRT